MIEDEQFFAWLDGELHGEDAAGVAAAVAASPELTARAEQHRRLKSGLRSAFDPVLENAPAPPRFESAEVVDLAARAKERERRRSWFAGPQLAAMAASLALGLVVGAQLTGPSQTGPVSVEDGRLVAAAELEQALDTRLASAPAGESLRIGLTFRDSSGRICRSFTGAEASGLACREGEAWQVKGLFPAAEGQSADYRMAAGEDPRLASLIDETIAGDPFDAAQEKAALERGWR